MVAAMPSGGWLQSSPIIPELGFCLGARLQMFWLEPGLPNSMAPGKRPRTTLSPTLVTRDGAAILAFGSPGGDNQDQWALQMLLGYVDFGLSLQAAIEIPTFYTDHFPSSFYPREAHPGRVHVEDRIPPAVLDALRRRGHEVILEGPWSLGWQCGVGREPDSGWLVAGASPRDSHGFASGR